MKKKWFVLICLLAAGILTACGGTKVDDAAVEKYSKKAEEVILLLNDGKYAELQEQFDKQMKEALPPAKMEELTPIIEQSGEFEKVDKTTVVEKENYTVVVAAVKYSNDDRVFTITFNEKDEIAGLYLK